MSARELFDLQSKGTTTQAPAEPKPKAKKVSKSAVNPNKQFGCSFCDKRYVSQKSVTLHEIEKHDLQRRARDLLETMAAHGRKDYTQAEPMVQEKPKADRKAAAERKKAEKMMTEPLPVPTEPHVQAALPKAAPAPIVEPPPKAVPKAEPVPAPKAPAPASTGRTVIATKNGKWF
jgi:hypothetical protein